MTLAVRRACAHCSDLMERHTYTHTYIHTNITHTYIYTYIYLTSLSGIHTYSHVTYSYQRADFAEFRPAAQHCLHACRRALAYFIESRVHAPSFFALDDAILAKGHLNIACRSLPRHLLRPPLVALEKNQNADTSALLSWRNKERKEMNNERNKVIAYSKSSGARRLFVLSQKKSFFPLCITLYTLYHYVLG